LTGLAESINLNPAEAERVLAEGLFKKSVDRDWAYCKAAGITAVPTFMVDRWSVVGAQPYDELRKLVLAAGSRRIG
jgi:predicted DsbA family dithiol-disulfide isomerase